MSAGHAKSSQLEAKLARGPSEMQDAAPDDRLVSKPPPPPLGAETWEVGFRRPPLSTHVVRIPDKGSPW